MGYDYGVERFPEELEGFGATFLIVNWVILMLVGIVFTVIMVIAYWKLFEKAGYEGWRSLIPFYSWWMVIKIAFGEPKWGLFLLTLVPFVNVVVVFYVRYHYAKSYNAENFMAILYIFFEFVIALIMAFSGKYQYMQKASEDMNYRYRS